MLHLLNKQRMQKRNNVKRIMQKKYIYYVYVCRANERLKSLTMLVLRESGKRRIYPTIAWSSILFRGPKSDRSNVASTFTFVQGLGRLLWLLLYS